MTLQFSQEYLHVVLHYLIFWGIVEGEGRIMVFVEIMEQMVA